MKCVEEFLEKEIERESNASYAAGSFNDAHNAGMILALQRTKAKLNECKDEMLKEIERIAKYIAASVFLCHVDFETYDKFMNDEYYYYDVWEPMSYMDLDDLKSTMEDVKDDAFATISAMLLGK